MATALENRVEAMLNKYYEEQKLVQPKISALEAKVRELKNGVRVNGDEHRELMQELKRLSDPDQFDGNGMRVNVVPFIKMMNQIKFLPATNPTPTGTDNGNKYRRNFTALEETINGAIYQDERSRAVVHQVKTMVDNKKMTMNEAKIILSLFLYEPPGSNGRDMGESRLASAQYN